MGKTGIVRKSKKEQTRDGELGLIIDEMGRAMWNAHRKYIAEGGTLTMNMSIALEKFRDFCIRNPG